MKKINVEKMNEEQLQDTEKVLSAKMNEIIAQAKQKANKHLKAYGLEAHMLFELTPLEKTNNLKGK